LKSFVDGILEIWVHLVVANLVKKKDAILVKNDPAAFAELEFSQVKNMT
jgi:hypothetical protein